MKILQKKKKHRYQQYDYTNDKEVINDEMENRNNQILINQFQSLIEIELIKNVIWKTSLGDYLTSNATL